MSLLNRLLAGIAFLLCSVVAAASHPLTMAVVEYPSPDPKESLVAETMRALSEHLADRGFRVVNIRFTEIERAMREGRIDFFLSSPGIYRELLRLGARDLVTLCTSRYCDVNRSEAATVVTLADAPFETIDALEGRSVAVKSRLGFVSYLVPMREILARGHDPENFFSREVVVDEQNFAEHALALLKSGEVDAVFLKHCLLEARLAAHPEEAGRFRVLDSQEAPGECRRSTRLYPSWVLATTKELPADVSREVLNVLLEVTARADDGSDLFWGVATDFSEVDALYRELKVGPYAYLREWTVRRFLEAYKPFIAAALLVLLGLVLHSVTVNVLVRRRTAELEAALEEQKRLKNRTMELASRMEKYQRVGAVSSLASIFAHEMHQPLASTAFYLDSLKTMLGRKAAAGTDLAEAIDGIERQTGRLAEIIRRVRSFIKAEKESMAPLDFSALVERTVHNFLATQVPEPETGLEIAPDLQVEGDRLELELAALNLLRNAADAVRSRAGGRIWVRLFAQRDLAVLEVRDNGAPIDDATLAGLGASLSSTKLTGLGLGLLLVKGIAERHRARIRFERAREGGLCARFEIGLCTEEKDA